MYYTTQIQTSSHSKKSKIMQKAGSIYQQMIWIDLDSKCTFPPTARNIKEALAWSEGKTELIVACHAGISRSSATAYVIASRVLGPKDALGILEQGHHWPNRLIVYLGSKLLKDDKIWDEFVNWQKTYNYLDPSQNNAWPTQEVKSQIYWD
jgi:hypothetical protein